MSTIEVNKIAPVSGGTAVTMGDSGDTFTVPTGAGLTVTDEVKTNKISPASGTTFTLGDSGDTFNIPSGATIANAGTATGFSSAVTPDNWQFFTLGSNFTLTANNITIITGWGTPSLSARNIHNFGTQYVTHSSGTFSFSTEGYYEVVFRLTGSTSGTVSGNAYINSTANNSSYADAVDNNYSTNGSGGFNTYMDAIFKIEDTSNDKLNFSVYSASNNSEAAGNTSRMRTYLRFIRLGTTT